MFSVAALRVAPKLLCILPHAVSKTTDQHDNDSQHDDHGQPVCLFVCLFVGVDEMQIISDKIVASFANLARQTLTQNINSSQNVQSSGEKVYDSVDMEQLTGFRPLQGYRAECSE